MPPKKKQQSIADFVSDEEVESEPEPAPSKRKSAAKKSTASAKSSTKEAAPKSRRGRQSKPADEDEEMQDVEEEEEGSEEEVIVVQKKGRGKQATAKAKATTKGKGKKVATPPPESEEEGDEEEEEEEEEEVEAPPAKKPAAKRGSKAATGSKKTTKKVAMEIPDTQQSPVKSASTGEDSDLEAPTPSASNKRASAATKAPPSPKKVTKPGRVSEIPPSSNMADLEARFAKLQMDYKELAQTRLTEPEKALEAFKRNTVARQKASEAALASLQENIQDQSTLPGEIRALNKAMAKKDAEIAVLKGKLSALNGDLEQLRSENTVLSSKLAARAANSAPPQPTVPGSAKKPSLSGRNGLSMNGAPAGAASWQAEAKEELYGDLCNLTILSVTKEMLQEDGDDEPMPYLVYECLQQTRNGTFHFRLKYAETPGEDRVTFQPLLDPKRDEKIISVIPDYMTDEIEFQKRSLCSFYEKLTTHARKDPTKQ